jgi:hypothetical protein
MVIGALVAQPGGVERIVQAPVPVRSIYVETNATEVRTDIIFFDYGVQSDSGLAAFIIPYNKGTICQ